METTSHELATFTKKSFPRSWTQRDCFSRHIESFSICLLGTYFVAGPELGTCEHTWRKEAGLLSQSVDTAAQGSGSC